MSHHTHGGQKEVNFRNNTTNGFLIKQHKVEAAQKQQGSEVDRKEMPLGKEGNGVTPMRCHSFALQGKGFRIWLFSEAWSQNLLPR